MNSDFGQETNVVHCIMTNISALERKIRNEEAKTEPNREKISVWEREHRKVQSALNKRRVMA